MNAHILDKRHSVTAGLCDVHSSYVTAKQAVSKVLIVRDDGTTLLVRVCRPCARAIAKNAGLKGER